MRSVSPQIGTLLLCVIFLNSLSVYATEYRLVSEGDKKGVTDELGQIIIPIVYEDIGWSDGAFSINDEVTGYFENGLWGVISTKNQKITKAIYRDLYPLGNGSIVASRYNQHSKQLLYGILDKSGRARVGFQYHSLADHRGILLVSQMQQGTLKWGVIDYTEQEIVDIGYDSIRVYSDRFVVYNQGRAGLISLGGEAMSTLSFHDIIRLGKYYLVSDDHGKEGLMDAYGNLQIPIEKKSIELLNDSLAEVENFPSWELLTTGNIHIKSFHFDQINPINHGVYQTTANNKQAIINIEGDYVLEGNNWKIQVPDEQFILVQVDAEYGVIREGGLEVLPIEFDSIYYSGRHFYALNVKDSQDEWRIYSLFGTLISSSVFHDVHPMSEDLIATKKNGYWGYIDFAGHTTIEYKYDYAWPFKDGRAKVNYLGNQGVISQSGEWVVSPTHLQVTIINQGLFINHASDRLELVDESERVVYQTDGEFIPHDFGLLEKTNSGKYGLVNEYGKSVHYPRYDSVSNLSGEKVYILKKGDEYGVIDQQGTFILNLTDEYQEIGEYSEEFLIIKKSNKYGFIDLDGKLRIANRYDRVKPFKNGMAAVKLLGKWGYIDKQERLVIQPKYDRVSDFQSGLSIVRKNAKSGLIDQSGNEVLPVEYDSIVRNADNTLILVKDGQFGLASETGSQLITPKYDLLQDVGNDQLIIEKRGKFGVIDRRGINVVATIYDSILYDAFNQFYLAKKSGKSQPVGLR